MDRLVKIDFENSFKFPLISLNFSGMDITPRKPGQRVLNFVKSWLFYFNIIWFYPDLIGEFIWLIEAVMMGKKLEELFMPTPCITVCILAIAKSWGLYVYRDVVKDVIEKFRNLHPCCATLDSNSGDEVERKIVKDAQKFLRMVIICFSYSALSVVVVFAAAPVLSMVYDYYTTGITELKFPFRVEYFIDPYTPVRWSLIYFHQFLTSLIVCIDVLSADILFYAFCAYLQMHFRLLCHMFENVATDASMGEMRINFGKAVKMHQELIELVGKIEILYSQSNLCNIMLSSLLICLSSFVVTCVDDVSTVIMFVTFLVMSLTQISLLCFFGDMLMNASTQVAEAVYKCHWCDAGPDIKRSVLLVMIRAQRPCKFTAMNFADLNLKAFTTILSRSWSYLALLNTMLE